MSSLIFMVMIIGVIVWIMHACQPSQAQVQAVRDGEAKKQQLLATTIQMSVTSPNKRAVDEQPLNWRAFKGVVDHDLIEVSSTKRYQKVLGFGAAFTDAACYMFNQLTPEVRAKLFQDLFNRNQMNLNVNRVCMGSSDYATHMYSYNEGEPDPEMKRFSIAHDKKYILPMLEEARKINPDIFLFASPWSPPGWMKSNKSMYGGNMQRQYMGAYALYFLKFLKAYEQWGVPVQAVTIQNEVDTDQDGRMPACLWPQEYEVDFVRYFLGPLLEKEKVKTQIWMIDHNYNLWGRALASLEPADLRKYCKAIAWHGYVGDAWRMTQVHDAYPEVDNYWTEGGPDVTNADYTTDWVKWGKTFTGNMRNWCRGITAWNLALDQEGKPNIGPFPCGGLVTIHSETKEITPSGQYFAIGHFSKYIKRDAYRVGSEGEIADLVHVAFENPQGDKVLVVTNSGAARTISVRLGDRICDVKLDGDSVTTLRFQ
jgi:glucosylceramidase